MCSNGGDVAQRSRAVTNLRIIALHDLTRITVPLDSVNFDYKHVSEARIRNHVYLHHYN